MNKVFNKFMPVFAPADADGGIAPVVPEKVVDKKNGMTRPAENTKTRQVWDIADQISAKEQRPALRSEVMEACLAVGMNQGTIATQYGRWCAYYGVDVAAKRELRAKEAAEKKAAKDAIKAKEAAEKKAIKDAEKAEIKRQKAEARLKAKEEREAAKAQAKAETGAQPVDESLTDTGAHPVSEVVQPLSE